MDETEYFDKLTYACHNNDMAESPKAFPPAEGSGERPGLGVRARYGVTLEASEDLEALVLRFIRPEAVRRLVGRQALRFGIADHQVEVLRNDRKSAYVLAKISSYMRSTEKYKKDIQFRLLEDGFMYNQVLDHKGAITGLSFQVATSPMMRGDIMRPPFFDDDIDRDTLLASIVFPSEFVVPNANKQAEEVNAIMHRPHPSAGNKLADFSFSLSKLKVTERVMSPESILHVVRPSDET